MPDAPASLFWLTQGSGLLRWFKKNTTKPLKSITTTLALKSVGVNYYSVHLK